MAWLPPQVKCVPSAYISSTKASHTATSNFKGDGKHNPTLRRRHRGSGITALMTPTSHQQLPHLPPSREHMNGSRSLRSNVPVGGCGLITKANSDYCTWVHCFSADPRSLEELEVLTLVKVVSGQLGDLFHGGHAMESPGPQRQAQPCVYPILHY